jgi:TonB-linked SusC/RagA family outer membrane protein
VTGVVKNASTGQPLAGVNVFVPGFSSAITEDNGSYSVKVPNASAIIEITGFGYAKQEIPVRGRTQIDIALYETAYKGATKNVYTPLGETSSTAIPYAWQSIAEDNNLSVAVTPNVLLQGYSTGVNVNTRSGVPGNGANIYLHGFNTMNAGNMPLFVVDGMPYENSAYASSLIGNYQANPLASIDIKDIESITILKDGASLYGVKGANGVVLIQTLKAKGLETKINAHVHFGINFEPKQLPVLNAMEHKNLLSDLYQQANPGIDPALINQLPFFNNQIPVQQPWGYEGNVDYYRYNHNTNWQNEIYNSSYNSDYYLNVSGGDEVAVYTLSLGYLNQEGTLKNTHFQRFNTRFNSEIKLSNTVSVLANMSFVYGNKALQNEGADAYTNPILSALTKAPFTTSHIYNADGILSPNAESADMFGSNPYVLVNNLSLENINYRFLGSFELAWKVNNHLDLHGLFGLNFNKEREKTFYPSVGVAFENLPTATVNNIAQHRVDRLFSLYGDVFANYKTNFGDAQNLSVRVGARYQNNQAENDWGQGYNSSSDDFKSIQYGLPLLRQVGGSLGGWNWMSLYANIDYALQNKYFLNISASADASSRYGSETATFLPYPSVGAAWLLSGEEWMKNLSVVNLLKLRLSYGLSGNDDIGNYSGIQYYKPQNLLGAYGLIRGNLVNSKLKPETVERLNAGLDVSFLNERVNLSLDVYSGKVKDMILFVTPDRYAGFDKYITNAGSMRNTGMDLSVNTRIINNASFKWDLGLTVSKYKNKVLDLQGAEYLTDILGATVQTKEGQPLGQFYGYKTNGVYATQAEAAQDGLHILQGLVPVAFQAGDVRFVNQNTDNLIDENDKVVIGDPNPDLFGSISNVFRYKQLTLNALLTYSLGNDVYNYTRSQLENMSTLNNQSKAVLNRWHYEGDVTDIPRAMGGDPMGNARFSDRWIEDGSYLRLKNITLSYDLGLKWKLIQNCVVFVTGENLVTLTQYKGLDPEFALGQNPLYYGIDACFVPNPKTVSVGLKLSL